MTPDEELLARLKDMGDYQQLRLLEDGTIIGLRPLMFSTALFVNMDLTGYETRYCFKHEAEALAAFQAMKTGDDEPEGWIARRPEPPGFYDLKK
jgi:hypothetical protein